jgi:hypothetical protein
MGERSAVRPQSGLSVCESDPGLRRPTPPATAGRKPVARPCIQTLEKQITEQQEGRREAGHPQPKIRRGAGQSPAVSTQRAVLGVLAHSSGAPASPLPTLDKSQIRTLADFIRTLDRGAGRHMGSNPCKPARVTGLAFPLSVLAQSVIARIHPHPYACKFFAGSSSCHSQYLLCLSDALRIAESAALALSIAVLEPEALRFATLGAGRSVGAVHHDGATAVSCRLCLIACNSSQFDVVGVQA